MCFVAITLCVASQRVFTFVYFFIDSVRKLLDTPSYYNFGLRSDNEARSHVSSSKNSKLCELIR
jgi:hypothetical protein